MNDYLINKIYHLIIDSKRGAATQLIQNELRVPFMVADELMNFIKTTDPNYLTDIFNLKSNWFHERSEK